MTLKIIIKIISTININIVNNNHFFIKQSKLCIKKPVAKQPQAKKLKNKIKL